MQEVALASLHAVCTSAEPLTLHRNNKTTRTTKEQEQQETTNSTGAVQFQLNPRVQKGCRQQDVTAASMLKEVHMI